MNINANVNSNITFQNRYKSLNVINPISYYSNRYFRRAAKISQNNLEPICPELQTSLSKIHVTDNKKLINVFDFNPGSAKNYVIFLHGMAQNVSNYQNLYKAILKKNMGVWAVEYRSYGTNPTERMWEDKLRKDVENAYRYMLKEKNIKPENIIVIGHSMGGALAANFASKHKDIKSLILVSPVTSAANVGDKFARHKTLGQGIPKKLISITNSIKPLKWLYSLRFNCLNKVKNIKCPTYIVQSKNDTVTPIKYARVLSKTARKYGVLGKFISVPGGGHKVDSAKVEEISKILDSFVK